MNNRAARSAPAIRSVLDVAMKSIIANPRSRIRAVPDIFRFPALRGRSHGHLLNAGESARRIHADGAGVTGLLRESGRVAVPKKGS
ncbi:hypothetical protein Q0Z83_013280 [Actinoplanes sichuanensis]|nr:hypothetical protein Q0Z83_013280 [Actinoplanes sichuanensis]